MIRPTIVIFLVIALSSSACSARETQADEKSMPAALASTETTPSADPDLRSYQTLVEWLLDVRLNDVQREELGRYADSYRYSDDPQRRQVFADCLQFYDQLLAMGPAERDAQCRLIRAITLTEQWKIARTGDPEANFMLDLYYAAHPPIAEGRPPLTRDIVDALMEFDYFFNVEVKGIKAEPMDAAFREKMYREAIAKWKTLDQAGQQEVFESASKVARHRLQWQQAAPEQRLLIKARVVGVQNLSAEEQVYLAQVQQVQAQMNQMIGRHQSQMITNELQFMRQNQQTIMGNGTYYNQTLGRWEQHGGIVTEFH